MDDRNRDKRNERLDDLTDELVQRARSEEPIDFVRPSPETIAAYLNGSADEAQVIEVQEALIESPEFRHEMLMLTRELGDVVEPEGMPAGPQRDSLWRQAYHGIGTYGKTMRTLAWQAIAAAAVLFVAIRFFVSGGVPTFALVEREVEPAWLISADSRSSAADSVIYRTLQEAAFAGFRSLLEWKDGQFEVRNGLETGIVPQEGERHSLTIVDRTGDRTYHVTYALPSNYGSQSLSLSVWLLSLPGRALYRADLSGTDDSLVELGIENSALKLVAVTGCTDSGCQPIGVHVLPGPAPAVSRPSASNTAAELPPWRAELNRAEKYANRLQIDSAISSANRALDVISDTDPEMGRVRSIIFDRLAFFQNMAGKYSASETSFLTAISLREEFYGHDNPRLAAVLNNLAFLYTKLGRFVEADTLFRQAINIYTHFLEDTSQSDSRVAKNFAQTLGNYGVCKAEQKRLDEAYRLFRTAADETRRLYGPEHQVLATWLSNLASVAHELGRLTEAESLYVAAINIISKKVSDPGHPKLVLKQYSLAEVYRDEGRYQKAEGICRLGLKNIRAAFGDNHWLVAYGLASLGYLAERRSIFAEALEDLDSALVIVKGLYGSNHGETATIREDIARIKFSRGSYTESIETAQKALEIRVRDFADNQSVMSEFTALQYSRLARQSFDTYLSAVSIAASEFRECPPVVGDMVLKASGVVWDAVSHRQMTHADDKYAEIDTLFEAWRDAKVLRSLLYNSGPDEDSDQGEFTSHLDSMSRVIDSLETQLVLAGLDSRSLDPLNTISAKTLAGELPDSVVLIQYLRYNLPNPPGVKQRKFQYSCWVCDGAGKQWLVPLGDGAQIDSLVLQYQLHMRQMAALGHPPLESDFKEYKGISQALWEALVAPLYPIVENRAEMIIIPDGAINMVSFAGLIDKDGSFLTEHHQTRYLTAGRDMLNRRITKECTGLLVAFGNPMFDAAAISEAQLVAAAPTGPASTDATSGSRSRAWSGNSLRDWKIESLPFSEREVESAAEAWRRGHNGEVRLFLTAEATESNFKRYAPSAEVVHVATHGFYFDDACLERTTNGADDLHFESESPLLHSGLLLAGVMSRYDAAVGDGEDGILSADEVSVLDFSSTRLIVLSACETGLGQIQPGEGMYGLRRAFLLAGAATVIATLWPINDETSASLLADIYGNGARQPSNQLHAAQIEAIARLRQNGLAPHPYLWAAFVSVGS